MPKTDEEVKLWLASLEAERHDNSWRHPVMNKYAPEIVETGNTPNQRYRDNVMFQAGRYAAGVRDAQAIKGHERATRLIAEGKA